MSQELMLFEIMADEAEVAFYIRDAELPGVIICGPYSAIGHTPLNRGDKFTVWFGTIARFSFKTLDEAESKAWEIIAGMKPPTYGRVTRRRGKEEYSFQKVS